jgi:ribosome-binding factor A
MKRRSGHSSSTPTGQRPLRVAERIRHILSDILQRGDLHDPELPRTSHITVTGVEIGPDLKHATAYIMPLGGKDADKAAEVLNRASGYLRSIIGHEMDLRYAPKVRFRVDHSFDQVAQVEKLLSQEAVRRDVAKKTDDQDE